MKAPDLGLEFNPESVESNRRAIDLAIKEHEAVVLHLRSLHLVNQSACPHAAKRDVYDPGYAGGGHDGYSCPTCGRRGYF